MTRTNLDMYEELGRWESGDKKNPKSKGNYGKDTNPFYHGKYQMGKPALIDAGYCDKSGFTGKDGIYSKQDFLNNPEAQEKAVRKFHEEKWKQLKGAVYEYTGKNVKEFLGKEINEIPITPSGLLIASHLVGQTSVAKYLKSNGTPNAENENGEIFFDGNGTYLEEYLAAFADYDVSETTKIPHKNWAVPVYMKKYSKNINQKKRDDFAAKKVTWINAKKIDNSIEKMNEINNKLLKEKEELEKNGNENFCNYLDNLKGYVLEKYKDCKNLPENEPKAPHAKNMTFKEYKANKHYPGRKNNIKGTPTGGAAPASNDEFRDKETNNKTVSNNAKQIDDDDFVDYSHDPFLEGFMGDDKYEYEKLVRAIVKDIKEASVDELAFLEGFYDDDNTSPKIMAALKERRRKISENTDPDGGYWFTSKNGKHIHVDGKTA